jgi:hypothetical protein
MAEKYAGQTVYRALTPALRAPLRTWAAGRSCAEPGCKTVLSIYNGGKHCSIHAPFARLRGGPPVGRPQKVA